MRAPDAPENADPFAVLGVSRDCTPEALHHAFRSLARRFHPDVNDQGDAGARMRAINAAYFAARRELAARAWRPAARVSYASGDTQPATSKDAAPNMKVVHPTSTSSVVSPDAAASISAASGVRYPPVRTPPAQPGTQWPGGRARAAQDPVPLGHRSRVQTRGLARSRAQTRLAAMTLIAVMTIVAATVLGWRLDHSPSGRTHPGILPPAAAGAAGQIGLGLDRPTSVNWPGLGLLTLTERRIAQIPGSRGIRESPKWSFDNQYIAMSTGDADNTFNHPAVVVIRARDGQIIDALAGTSPRWSPRTEQLALLAPLSAPPTPQLEIVTMESGHPSLAQGLAAAADLAWSPDGTIIALSSPNERTLRLFNTTTAALAQLVRVPVGQRLIPLRWLDGQTLLCSLRTNGDTKLVTVDTTNATLTILTDLGTARVPPALVPDTPQDGDQILYAARSTDPPGASLYTLDRQTHATASAGAGLELDYLAGWSPGAHWLALAPPSDVPQVSSICLLWVSGTHRSRTLFGAIQCLRIEGSLAGLAWEARGLRLSYVRMHGRGLGPELREIVMDVSGAASSAGATPYTDAVMPSRGILSLAILPSAASFAP